MSTQKQIVVKNRIGVETEVARKVLEALLGREDFSGRPLANGTTSYDYINLYETKHFEVTWLGVGKVGFALGLQKDSGEWKGGLVAETLRPEKVYTGDIRTVGDEIFVNISI